MLRSFASVCSRSTQQLLKNPLILRSLATQAEFDIEPFKLHKLDDGPPIKATLTRDEGLEYYEQMTMIRRMENAADRLYKARVIRGFCHLYSGQMATLSIEVSGQQRLIASLIQLSAPNIFATT